MCFHFSETAFGNFICMKDTFAWKEEKIKKEKGGQIKSSGNPAWRTVQSAIHVDRLARCTQIQFES